MDKRLNGSRAQQPLPLRPRSFGLLAYMRAAGIGRSDFLVQIENHQPSLHRIPKSVGSALRLAALLELREARIFSRMALRFGDVAPVHAFFDALRCEGEEQARTFMLCLYSKECALVPDSVPSIRDPEMRQLLRELRACERGVWRLSLDEALDLTQHLKASQINLIFAALLQKIRNPQNELYIARLAKNRRLAYAIPRKINELRMEIADLD